MSKAKELSELGDAVTVDSGNVGIGTSSPTGEPTRVLHIHNTTNAGLHITDDASGTTASDGAYLSFDNPNLYIQNKENGPMLFYTNNSERMRIDSSGNVGIGTSPSNLLHVNGSSSQQDVLKIATAWSTSGDYVGMVMGDGWIRNFVDVSGNGNRSIAFAPLGTERVRITGNGDLLVGTTSKVDSNGVGLHVAINQTVKWPISISGHDRGMVYYTTATSGQHYYTYFVYNGTGVGSITSTGSSTAYNTTSDYRLKENVTYDWDATTRLKQLKPARFNFIADADKTVDGFLAHEVSSIVPEAILGEKDEMQTEEYEVTPAVLDDDGNVVTEAVMGTREVPKYQGIDQSKLVPLLVKTIQELEARITALEGN